MPICHNEWHDWDPSVLQVMQVKVNASFYILHERAHGIYIRRAHFACCCQ